MPAKKGTFLLLMLVVGLLLSAFVLPGCSRQQKVVVQPQASASTPQPTATVARTTGPTIIRQAERDYYVDSSGALHLITRREAVSGGGLYYIEGDERGWYLDEGGRLYYREPAGRVVYYEDAYPARSGSMGYAQPAVSAESCENQWRNCVAGCEAISPRQRYDRPNCLRNCDAIRSGCLGR